MKALNQVFAWKAFSLTRTIVKCKKIKINKGEWLNENESYIEASPALYNII